MKPCPHCGKELPQEMQFCPYCMEKLMAETPVGATLIRRRRWWLWLLIPLCVLLLWLLWRWIPREGTPAHTAAVTKASLTPTTTLTGGNSPISTTSTATTTATRATTRTAATTTTTTASTTGGVHIPTTDVPTMTTPFVTGLCAAGHDWAPITETVHIDEVGHYETKTVEKQMTLFRCAICYEEHDNLTDYYAHFDDQHSGDALQGIFRDRYETVTEYREVEEQTWVVDTPAYDKTVTVGRRCRICDKTENNQ